MNLAATAAAAGASCELRYRVHNDRHYRVYNDAL